MRRTALQTKPRWNCRPGPVQNDKNTPPFSTPGTSINGIGLLEIENKIQLVGREMKCKNNRWKKVGEETSRYQKSPSDDGGESSRGGSCPETDVSWERLDASGGGDSGRLSTPIDMPGEGVFALLRDIFSLRFCSREISAFKPSIFFCNCWFNFSSCTIWLVADWRRVSERLWGLGWKER